MRPIWEARGKDPDAERPSLTMFKRTTNRLYQEQFIPALQ